MLGSFAEFIESSFHYTVKGLKQLLFIMDASEESPHIPPAGSMMIRSTLSNDNKRSNRVYTTNDITSPRLLTPSIENALSRRTLAQRGRRERERNRQLREPTNFKQPAQQQLSKQSVAQRARRERERQLREFIAVPQLYEQGVTNHSLASTSQNLAEEFNINLIESDDERNIDNEGNDNVNEVDEGNINSNDDAVQLGCHFLGQMDVVCTHCSALHWKDEQLLNSSIINPLFGQCCLQGKIKIPILKALPNEFQELYDGNGSHSRSFRRYMREYNAADAFMSLGVQMDDRVSHGQGPSSFVIHRELHHRIGALVPNEEQEASYVQLYIYNPGASLNTCHKRNPCLNRDVLKVIQGTLV
ncbi:hypothetical protein GIB67_022144 [Kingdonia uniflora]|uniref:Helitron helicase-like domain-containing protein n=1 Tax=Kingdonia uniflora TaxID=39325 RepID=A0A7J7N8L6_9MAGN|nr:hypothetical protein GIB67_022144 [Kingdonia uniflora]